MAKFKLSAVSMALIAGGLAVGSSQGFAETCENETRTQAIRSQEAITINNCKFSLNKDPNTATEDNYFSLTGNQVVLNDVSVDSTAKLSWGTYRLFRVENASISAKNGRIDVLFTEKPSTIFGGSPIYSLTNSTLTLNNITVTSNLAEGGFGEIIFAQKNSNVTIDNSHITVNKPEPESSFTASVLISVRDSNATISNSTLTYNKGMGLFDLSSGNLTLNNVKGSVPDANDAFVIGNIHLGDNKVTVNNSTLTATNGIVPINGGTGDVSKLSVTLNKSSLQSSKDLLIVSEVREKEATVSLTANDSTLSGRIITRRNFEPAPPHQVNVNLNNSTYTGYIVTASWPSIGAEPKTNVTLTNNTRWNMASSSDIYDLNAENSVIDIQREDPRYMSELTINGNLTGNAHFTLNTDLAKQWSDTINIKGNAEGKHTLSIRNTAEEPRYANGSVTLVKTNTGDAVFSLKDREFVDAGAYRYHLFKEGTNWVLSNRTLPDVVVPPVSEQPATTEGARQPVVSEDVKPSEQPVVSGETKPSEQPVVSEETKPSEQPVVSGETKPSEQPVVSEETKPSEQPVVSGETKPSEQSAVTTDTKQLDKTTTQTTNTAPANHNAEAGVVIGAGAVVTNTANQVVPPAPQPTSHQVVLSEKPNALVSLRQAQLVQLENNLVGIHQRLGELKNGEKGNVWVRNVNGRNELASTATASNSRSSGFTQNQHTLQLGADTAVSDNVRLGGFVGTSRSNVDFNGEYGSGKVKSQAVGLYGTLLSDSGLYWDNLAKYEWMTAESASTGKRRYHAYTLSSEVGKIFSFGNEWKLTPNAQLAWTNLSGRGDEDSISAVSSRLGLRFAKGFNLANGWNLQPYAEVNAINSQTNRNAVSVNQYRFEVEESGSRVETVLGLTAGNGNHRLGLEVKNSNGKRLDQPFVLQANYRYSW